jgi:hypothetical protein
MHLSSSSLLDEQMKHIIITKARGYRGSTLFLLDILALDELPLQAHCPCTTDGLNLINLIHD